MEENSFDPDLIHALFKSVWKRKAQERERSEGDSAADGEVGAGSSKKSRPMSANANALKLSSELLRIFIAGKPPEPYEAVQRASIIAEAEGANQIEATHLERILPQLLLDF